MAPRSGPPRSGPPRAGAPHRWHRTLAALTLLILAACGSEELPHARNLLLISMDSVRPDHISAYGRTNSRGAGTATSPGFERLAAEGVLFENAVSTSSWTLPSHAALLTGLPDQRHGLVDNDLQLDPALTTLAELLAGEGFATGGFFSGPNLHPAFGFDQGFDSYVNCSRVEMDQELFESDELGRFRAAHQKSHQAVTSPILLERAGTWIRDTVQKDDRPFFAFVHWWDPHYDYIAPSEIEQQFVGPYEGHIDGRHRLTKLYKPNEGDIAHLLDMYDAEIRHTDDHVEQLMGILRELNVLDDTLVVVTSDHGEEFWERTRWGHQRSLYDEVVQIPMAMRFPARIPAGARAGGQAGLQDIFTTAVDLLGLTAPDYVQGNNLEALWLNPQHRGFDQALYLFVPRVGIELVGMRTASHKIIWDETLNTGWFWNLNRDPAESNPTPFKRMDAAHAPVVAFRKFRAEQARLRRLQPSTENLAGSEMSSDLIDALNASGYLGSDEDEDAPPPRSEDD